MTQINLKFILLNKRDRFKRLHNVHFYLCSLRAKSKCQGQKTEQCFQELQLDGKILITKGHWEFQQMMQQFYFLIVLIVTQTCEAIKTQNYTLKSMNQRCVNYVLIKINLFEHYQIQLLIKWPPGAYHAGININI